MSASDAVVRDVGLALNEGDYARAVKLLTKALAREPKNAALHASRGVVHLLHAENEWPAWKTKHAKERKAALERALRDLNRALAIHADYAEALLNRGSVYAELDEPEAANADFSRAIELGLEPLLAIEAYSQRSSTHADIQSRVADIDAVKALRRRLAPSAKGTEVVAARLCIRAAVPTPTVTAIPVQAPRKRASNPSPAAVVARFEALTQQVLAVRVEDAAKLRALEKKIDDLDLLEASDAPALRKTIASCIARLRKHRKTAPEPLARRLDDILDSITDS